MTRPAPPSYEDVCELPREVKGFVIPASFEDENGHMNIRHYLDLGSQGNAAIYARVGITDDYRATRRQGFFTAEHHLRYVAEVFVGDSVSVHVRVLDRSDKVVHAMAFLVNDTRGELAFILEVITPHVDLATRRTTPFAADIAAAWDDELGAAVHVTWDPPVCGSMGIRR